MQFGNYRTIYANAATAGFQSTHHADTDVAMFACDELKRFKVHTFTAIIDDKLYAYLKYNILYTLVAV